MKTQTEVSVALNPRRLDELLDPAETQYTSEFFLIENLTARLVRFNSEGDYQLDLASNIKVIKENLFEISIKKSSFSNGELITVEDVKNSILRTVKKGSSHTQLRDNVESIYTEHGKLYISLRKSVRAFFYFLSLPDMGILHKTQYSKERLLAEDFQSISSGPFRYEKRGDSYYLIKNPGYTLGRADYPARFKLVSPFQENLYEKIIRGEVALGEVDLGSFIANQDSLKKNGDIKIMGNPSDSFTYIYFNEKSNKFKNQNHRDWLRRKIWENFKIPKEMEPFATKSSQYFPQGSDAFISEDEAQEHYLKLPTEKPEDFPDEIIIRTYKNIYSVTFEPLIKSLEKIEGLKLVIKENIGTSDYVKMMKQGEFDIFLNCMSTDLRVPVEGINYEYFAGNSNLVDVTGVIKKEYELFQLTMGNVDGKKHLQNISRQMLKDGQFIPLFHSIIPYLLNVNLLDTKYVSPQTIFNFWQFKAR